MLREYAFGGQLPGDARGFSDASQALWQAVRRHTGPKLDRVANNVLAVVAGATPWPVNIGWATLGGSAILLCGLGER